MSLEDLAGRRSASGIPTSLVARGEVTVVVDRDGCSTRSRGSATTPGLQLGFLSLGHGDALARPDAARSGWSTSSGRSSCVSGCA